MFRRLFIPVRYCDALKLEISDREAETAQTIVEVFYEWEDKGKVNF